MSETLIGMAAAGRFPALPDRLQRGDIERILTVISSGLGLSSARLRALLVMMQTTRPSDWTDPGRDAVCFMRQQQVAARLGITPRALRAHEVALERAGLIERQLGADGGRGRFSGGRLIQGISFTPLITRVPALVRLHDARLAEEQRMQMLRRQISASKRALTQAIGRLLELVSDHPALPNYLLALRAAPRRYEGLDVAALDLAFRALDSTARDALAELDLQQKSSVEPEENFRPHYQDTTEDNLEICSRDEEREGAAEPEPKVVAPTPPSRTSICPAHPTGGEDENPSGLALWLFDPGQLYRMASEDMQLYIEAVRRKRASLTPHDFVQASLALLPALGCDPRLWDAAADVLGDFGAALAVLVIDANRTHPQFPIRSTGAALRAFIRLAEAGRLNLAGSLIGLYRRKQTHPETAS